MFFFILVSGKKKTKISSLDTGYKSISHRRNRPVCRKINIITLVELKEKCWSQNTIYYLTVVHFLNFYFFWCLFFLNNEKKIKNHLTQRKEHQAGVSQFTFVNSLPVTSSFPNTVGVNIPTNAGKRVEKPFQIFFPLFWKSKLRVVSGPVVVFVVARLHSFGGSTRRIAVSFRNRREEGRPAVRRC